MYKSLELFENLSPEEITRILLLSSITEKENYTEIEADRFHKCQELIQQNKTDEEITDLLSQDLVSASEATPNFNFQASKPKNSKKLEKSKDISQLLLWSCKKLNAKISLTEAINILQFCGLQEQDEYNSAECDRFLEASGFIKRQEKTFEELRIYYGVQPTSETEAENDIDFELTTNETVELLSDAGQELFEEMMHQKAKGDASLAPVLYLKYLAQEMGSPEYQSAWKQMEEALKAKFLGKIQNRFKSKFPLGSAPQTLPERPLPSNNLPLTSENGSIVE
ncbi:hypothetical protein [Dendronalium sp. ChiSLP03b]|uniref:hypothetical protein n=1 Tax=Dendronalium sp. ChiSLP03b TaxID=3075381 RepID=UPI002AD21208|nr:hypothetical protein [Dendronalium sp. ChiSLP03b]MDZ8208640.1 hypothetical protein [Dendronalium sp. ChiSLP03b]